MTTGVLKELGVSVFGPSGHLLMAHEIWPKVVAAIQARRESGEWTTEEAALRYDVLLPEDLSR